MNQHDDTAGDGADGTPARAIETEIERAELACREGDEAGALEALTALAALTPGRGAPVLATVRLHRRAGRLRLALRLCLDRLEHSPEDIEIRQELAECLDLVGYGEEARQVHRRLLRDRPDAAASWSGLGRLLLRENHFGAAEACLRRALRLDPAHLPSLEALGRLLTRQNENAAARGLLQTALAVAAEPAPVQTALAHALLAEGRDAEALDWLDRALAHDPAEAEARALRAVLLERTGRREEAWEDAAWARRLGPPPPLANRVELWQGEEIDGLTLLLEPEGPASRSLRMLRALPALVARGIAPVVRLPAGLLPLVEGGALPARFVAEEAGLDELPPADRLALLPDLPRLLGLDPLPPLSVTPPPRPVPPLTPPRPTRLRVGLAWGGDSPAAAPPPAEWLALGLVPGVALFGLEPAVAGVTDPTLIADLSPDLTDAAALAARLNQLDLVIGMPSLATELAAMLGRPVWQIVPAEAEACWGDTGETSPLHPTMRLFRIRGERVPPLERIATALAEAVAARSAADAATRAAAGRPEALAAALLAPHLLPGGGLIDVEAGGDGGALALTAAHAGLPVLALAPHRDDIDRLRRAIAAAGVAAERIEPLAVAAAATPGGAIATAAPRAEQRVFPLPAWVPAPVALTPLAALLAERPDWAERPLLLRLGPERVDEILDGLGPLLSPDRIAALLLVGATRPALLDRLAAAGFTAWSFPDPANPSGALAPANPSGALAPAGAANPAAVRLLLPTETAPAGHYGPAALPPDPAVWEEARAEAARLGERGRAHATAGQRAEAVADYGAALQLDPFQPDANLDTGRLLARAGRRAAAALCFRRALARRADPAASADLGATLRELGQIEAAAAVLDAALAGDPAALPCRHGLALVKRDQGDLDGAIRLLRGAVTQAPDDTALTQALAETQLAAGLLSEGLAQFGLDRPPPAGPAWDGSPLEGRALVVDAGGDPVETVLLARYLPLTAARGGLLTLVAPAELRGLLDGLAGIERVRPPGPPPEEERDALHVRLSDLPRLLGGPAGALPPPTLPYLPPPPATPRLESNLRVGLAWGGFPRRGACPLDPLLPLAAEAGVTLVALAGTGAATNDLAAAGASLLVEAAAPPGNDTLAARLAEIDLVIGGDRLETHLAAAMGLPVWLIPPAAPTWRWPWQREDSPWYPSVRLFPRGTGEGWRGPIERIAAALRVVAAPSARTTRFRLTSSRGPL